jgi:lysophospholipase L1-like esterase
MPAVTGKRVLIFGDSLSTGTSSPGAHLAAQLGTHGADVRINARIGRSAWNFYGREDYDAQLTEVTRFAPHIAIVQLGTNDIGLSLATDMGRMNQLKIALAHGGATEVWAVGPPSFGAPVSEAKGVDAVASMMQQVFGERFVDLRPLTRDVLTTAAGRAADGVHFTAAGGELVGKRIAAKFLVTETGGIGMLAVLALGVLAWALLR